MHRYDSRLGVTYMRSIKPYKSAKLGFADSREMSLIVDELKKVIVYDPYIISTACNKFYTGCMCDGCRKADNENVMTWPKVGDMQNG